MDVCPGLKVKVIHYVEIVLGDIPHPDAFAAWQLRGGEVNRG